MTRSPGFAGANTRPLSEDGVVGPSLSCPGPPNVSRMTVSWSLSGGAWEIFEGSLVVTGPV